MEQDKETKKENASRETKYPYKIERRLFPLPQKYESHQATFVLYTQVTRTIRNTMTIICGQITKK
ncbi:hypothetical protein ACH0R4_RS16430 [Bacillus cytotoxicus]|nr:hypothetical protein [Bacillus cytotoxicus]